ncbi:MAG: ATP-binding protein [Chloroflexi bacterium]|nr:ATP-binding protein [Chloroflexota bacterium]
MIEIILNAVKIAFSEDFRTSASAVIDFVRRSPDWQNDICVLEAHVDKSAFEHAYLLGGLTCDKMRNLGFSDNCVDDFRTTYDELVKNAIEHGNTLKKRRRTKLTIVIEITSHYVSVTINNPKGVKFDLDSILESRITSINRDSNAARGRGLIIASLLADSLIATKNGEGVKATFYKPAVVIRQYSLGQVSVIEVREGLENPSLAHRLRTLMSQHLESDFIIHLGMLSIDRQAAEPRKRLRTELLSEIISASLERHTQVLLVFGVTPGQAMSEAMSKILPESVLVRDMVKL